MFSFVVVFFFARDSQSNTDLTVLFPIKMRITTIYLRASAQQIVQPIPQTIYACRVRASARSFFICCATSYFVHFLLYRANPCCIFLWLSLKHFVCVCVCLHAHLIRNRYVCVMQSKKQIDCHIWCVVRCLMWWHCLLQSTIISSSDITMRSTLEIAFFTFKWWSFCTISSYLLKLNCRCDNKLTALFFDSDLKVKWLFILFCIEIKCLIKDFNFFIVWIRMWSIAARNRIPYWLQQLPISIAITNPADKLFSISHKYHSSSIYSCFSLHVYSNYFIRSFYISSAQLSARINRNCSTLYETKRNETIWIESNRVNKLNGWYPVDLVSAVVAVAFLLWSSRNFLCCFKFSIIFFLTSLQHVSCFFFLFHQRMASPVINWIWCYFILYKYVLKILCISQWNDKHKNLAIAKQLRRCDSFGGHSAPCISINCMTNIQMPMYLLTVNIIHYTGNHRKY